MLFCRSSTFLLRCYLTLSNALCFFRMFLESENRRKYKKIAFPPIFLKHMLIKIGEIQKKLKFLLSIYDRDALIWQDDPLEGLFFLKIERIYRRKSKNNWKFSYTTVFSRAKIGGISKKIKNLLFRSNKLLHLLRAGDKLAANIVTQDIAWLQHLRGRR